MAQTQAQTAKFDRVDYTLYALAILGFVIYGIGVTIPNETTATIVVLVGFAMAFSFPLTSIIRNVPTR